MKYLLMCERWNAMQSRTSAGHFYGWKAGLKTGMYYLRTKAATDAIKFTVDKAYETQPEEALVSKVEEISHEEAVQACSLENGADCEMCSG